MILFGVSAEVSIGELFVAGVGPGLLIGGALMLFVWLYSKYMGWGKNDGDGRLSFGKATWQASWALLMPVIVLGGIYGGIFTPTEASAVAVLYSFIVGTVIYREIGFKDMYNILRKSVISSAVIMFIIANAGLFAFMITRAGVPAAIGAWLQEVLQSPVYFLLGVNAALFIIGMFIETSAAIIVLAPILVPVAIHFGIEHDHPAFWCEPVCCVYGGENIARPDHQRPDPLHRGHLGLFDADQLCACHFLDIAGSGFQ
jgi:tripartite ATP-independent transporter DctM subunit